MPTYRQKVRALEEAKGIRPRKSASARGYGHRWRTFRAWFLRQPNNIMCAICKTEVATEVDHIKRVSGPDDPLFYKEGNHQGLCHECHSKKTATEDHGFGV